MAGGFDEKAGGAQMGVMQGPMVSERWWDLLPLLCSFFFYSRMFMNLLGCYSFGKVRSLDRPSFHQKTWVKDLHQQASSLLKCLWAKCRIFTKSSGVFWPFWRGTDDFLTWTWHASHGCCIRKLADGHIIITFFTRRGDTQVGFKIIKDERKQLRLQI